MKVDEELFARGVILAYERELAAMPDEEEDIPVHVFSDAFEEKMEELIRKLGKGELERPIAPLGFPYYVRRSIAAVLIAFLLTCIAAPDAVMAGYKKIVETIKTIVTEYTEWQYTSVELSDKNFKKAIFGYLPNSFKEETNVIEERKYFVLLSDGHSYFNFQQGFVTNTGKAVYLLDTENGELEIRYIGNDLVRFSFNSDIYSYVWIYENYLIKGQSNLSIDEIMKILENITFE